MKKQIIMNNLTLFYFEKAIERAIELPIENIRRNKHRAIGRLKHFTVLIGNEIGLKNADLCKLLNYNRVTVSGIIKNHNKLLDKSYEQFKELFLNYFYYYNDENIVQMQNIVDAFERDLVKANKEIILLKHEKNKLKYKIRKNTNFDKTDFEKVKKIIIDFAINDDLKKKYNDFYFNKIIDVIFPDMPQDNFERRQFFYKIKKK